MIEAVPRHVLACFAQPFISQFEDSVQVIGVATENQHGSLDPANAFHGSGLVGILADHFNVVVLDFGSFSRRRRTGVDAQELVGCRLNANARRKIIFRRSL